MVEEVGRSRKHPLLRRALRAAGIPLGPARCSMRLRPCGPLGWWKEDFYWTLHTVFVKRHEHSVMFDQAFKIFFRKRAISNGCSR